MISSSTFNLSNCEKSLQSARSKWVEQGEKQQLETISSTASSAIMKEREARKKTQANRQILFITGATVFVAFCIFAALLNRYTQTN